MDDHSVPVARTTFCCLRSVCADCICHRSYHCKDTVYACPACSAELQRVCSLCLLASHMSFDTRFIYIIDLLAGEVHYGEEVPAAVRQPVKCGHANPCSAENPLPPHLWRPKFIQGSSTVLRGCFIALLRYFVGHHLLKH